MFTALHPTSQYPTGQYLTSRYVCLQSAPPVSAREVEDPLRKVVFLSIRWGDSLLFSGEINPKKGFYLGEPLNSSDEHCFAVSDDVLGADRLPLVSYRMGVAYLTIPGAARASVAHAGRPSVQFSAADSKAPWESGAGPDREVQLSEGSRAELHLGRLRFDIEHTAAGRKSERKGLFPEPEVLGFYALSFAVIGSLLGAMAYFLPALGLLEDEGVQSDERYLMMQYLDANAERQVNPDEPLGGATEGGSTEPAAQAPAEKIPDVAPSPAGKRPLGTSDSASRAETIAAAREFGMVSLLETLGTQNSAAAWQSEIHAMGGETSGLWGDEFGDISGTGLRLSGDGHGSGGPGLGVDLGDIAGLNGKLPGPGGFGHHADKPGVPPHVAKVPTVRSASPTVSGHLLAEVVQRTVRQNFGRFRMCYEQGLVRNPGLTGRVEIRFLIDSSGAVAQAMQGASDLPDPDVTSCIVKQFFALSFPQPENGTVRVTYPLSLSPAE